MADSQEFSGWNGFTLAPHYFCAQSERDRDSFFSAKTLQTAKNPYGLVLVGIFYVVVDSGTVVGDDAWRAGFW